MGIEQSWETCRYAITTKPDNDDISANNLKKHGLFGVYCCENRNILNLKTYDITLISDDNNSIKETASLTGLFIGWEDLSEREIQSLEYKIKRSISRCKHCKFYELKTDLEKK